MKNIKFIVIIFLGTLCFYAPKILASKSISFPNSNNVQPAPDEITPNISGNIEWPAGTTTNTDTNQNIQSNDTENSDTKNDTSQNPPNVNVTTNGNYGTQNNNGSAASTPAKPSINAQATSNISSNDVNNPNETTDQAKQQNQNNPSDPFSYFDTIQSQNNSQTQNSPTKNAGIQDNSTNSATDQDNTLPQNTPPQLSYEWIMVYGSITLLIVAFMIWRLKKIPNDVNQ